jgi:hypothetical protein
MDTASTATGGAGGVVHTDLSLEYLKFVRHHFLSKVFRCTPSGRQQSAVLLLLPDALCLLTHRGGLHTYIPLKHLVAISLYPRARMCFHVKKRHDLLITCTQQPRLVSAVAQLFLGLTGALLPVHQDEAPPSLETLQLRPSADYHPCVPAALLRTLRSAAITAASFGTVNAVAALVDPTGAPTDHLNGGAAAHNPRAHRDALSLDNSSFLADATPPRASSTSAPAGVAEEASRLLHGGVAGSTRCSPLFADPSSGATILVVESTSSTTVLTVPAYRSVWEYLAVLAERIPGGTQSPTVIVKCVEVPHKQVAIHSRLFHQTMLLLAEEHPHMVTLQKRRTDEGHHFDGSVLWLSLLETSTGMR